MAEHSPEAYLLVDETYREAAYGDVAVAASAVDLGSRVITTSSLSKCLGAPGLCIGWAVTRDTSLREQPVTAKFGTVLSCGGLDEQLALRVLGQRARILGERREQLARNLATTEAWVRPDADALCCVRLRPEVFDAVGVERFLCALPEQEVRVGDSRWFGEEPRVFRLGFGLLAAPALAEALQRLSRALHIASMS